MPVAAKFELFDAQQLIETVAKVADDDTQSTSQTKYISYNNNNEKLLLPPKKGTK